MSLYVNNIKVRIITNNTILKLIFPEKIEISPDKEEVAFAILINNEIVNSAYGFIPNKNTELYYGSVEVN